MWYRSFRALFRAFFAVLYRWKVDGLEHIPKEGPVVICSNHINNLDPPLVGSALQRPIRFMAKEELFKIPVLSFLLPRFGAFPVKRGASDKRALKKSLQLLGKGEVLGVFPEGTRSKTGELGEAHTGAAFIALKGNATVIPAAIIGPYRLFRRVRIVFGPPLDLSDYRGNRFTSQAIREVTERMMDRIGDLMADGSER
ncbi:lysophospholipid acyltransferase family protein [Paludifilum halophilum]|uniref:1-acyl-sn-glycerol-3-phosphate acyltransferase n=1 Tax=Paludifilum halophilum TaxID=1642702 RepID=A0A235BCP2_9BACL|nr:lysophospholipid acyltransferase family protein [Paludifilum halophilum]OYD09737.1 1-acyl-sn-glycerol-3-phosphate acyltransferase [Paludifilum halophilum]